MRQIRNILGRGREDRGITGLWQIRGRSDGGFDAMLKHDVEYAESWSVWLDFRILVETLPAVLRGRGAY